jgi:hypothetical protein
MATVARSIAEYKKPSPTYVCAGPMHTAAEEGITKGCSFLVMLVSYPRQLMATALTASRLPVMRDVPVSGSSRMCQFRT